MADSATSVLPLEYVHIHDLPPVSALPEELRGKVLFTRVNFLHSKAQTQHGADSGTESGPAPREAAGNGQRAPNGASNSSAPNSGKGASSSGKGTGGGFNYSKALKAAMQGAGSSVATRGDGKFEGGKDFAVSDAPGGRAKLVHLTPDALAPGNADRTLAELDLLQQQAGALQRGSGAAQTSSGPSTSRPPPRPAHVQHADLLASAAHVLYDIGDEDSRSGSGGAAPSGTSAAVAASPTPVGGPSEEATPSGLRIPEYSLRELPPDGPTGQEAGPGRLEVCVALPDVATPAEVEVWLAAGGGVLQVSVPGKYSLKLALPCPMIDDTSAAKWSKAKRRLTLTLTKAMGR